MKSNQVIPNVEWPEWSSEVKITSAKFSVQDPVSISIAYWRPSHGQILLTARAEVFFDRNRHPPSPCLREGGVSQRKDVLNGSIASSYHVPETVIRTAKPWAGFFFGVWPSEILSEHRYLRGNVYLSIYEDRQRIIWNHERPICVASLQLSGRDRILSNELKVVWYRYRISGKPISKHTHSSPKTFNDVNT